MEKKRSSRESGMPVGNNSGMLDSEKASRPASRRPSKRALTKARSDFAEKFVCAACALSVYDNDNKGFGLKTDEKRMEISCYRDVRVHTESF